MHERLVRALLEDIGHPVSAAVSIGKAGEMLYVHLFDTMRCGEPVPIRVSPDAAELWLISHHGDGILQMHQEDWENLRRMHRLAGGRRLRLFLCGVDMPCREIELSHDLLNVL